jgi:hypothetical protein
MDTEKGMTGSNEGAVLPGRLQDNVAVITGGISGIG